MFLLVGSGQICQHTCIIALLPLLWQPSNRCQSCIPNWQWGSIHCSQCGSALAKLQRRRYPDNILSTIWVQVSCPIKAASRLPLKTFGIYQGIYLSHASAPLSSFFEGPVSSLRTMGESQLVAVNDESMTSAAPQLRAPTKKLSQDQTQLAFDDINCGFRTVWKLPRVDRGWRLRGSSSAS